MVTIIAYLIFDLMLVDGFGSNKLLKFSFIPTKKKCIIIIRNSMS